MLLNLNKFYIINWPKKKPTLVITLKFFYKFLRIPIIWKMNPLKIYLTLMTFALSVYMSKVHISLSTVVLKYSEKYVKCGIVMETFINIWHKVIFKIKNCNSGL